MYRSEPLWSLAEPQQAPGRRASTQRSIVLQDKTNKVNTSRKQIMKMLLVIMIVFITCWCPRSLDIILITVRESGPQVYPHHHPLGIWANGFRRRLLLLLLLQGGQSSPCHQRDAQPHHLHVNSPQSIGGQGHIHHSWYNYDKNMYLKTFFRVIDLYNT